ncbi:MAG TPA: DNA-formamidopyrimidine glycosylase family protein, partial [Arachnia sp.]|nr:DNA-formamidopyrimidine glycosylase family protein [Arachnia sp.]
MPEGDSVWRLSERLQPLTGRAVESSSFRVPQLATASLDGATISRVWPHGKHLFWRLDDDTGSRVLHTHLRMEGHWRVHAVGTRWSAPAHTARIVVRVSGGVELVGHELGLVELWPADEFDRRMGHLGPDLLADDWTT